MELLRELIEMGGCVGALAHRKGLRAHQLQIIDGEASLLHPPPRGRVVGRGFGLPKELRRLGEKVLRQIGRTRLRVDPHVASPAAGSQPHLLVKQLEIGAHRSRRMTIVGSHEFVDDSVHVNVRIPQQTRDHVGTKRGVLSAVGDRRPGRFPPLRVSCTWGCPRPAHRSSETATGSAGSS